MIIIVILIIHFLLRYIELQRFLVWWVGDLPFLKLRTLLLSMHAHTGSYTKASRACKTQKWALCRCSQKTWILWGSSMVLATAAGAQAAEECTVTLASARHARLVSAMHSNAQQGLIWLRTPGNFYITLNNRKNNTTGYCAGFWDYKEDVVIYHGTLLISLWTKVVNTSNRTHTLGRLTRWPTYKKYTLRELPLFQTQSAQGRGTCSNQSPTFTAACVVQFQREPGSSLRYCSTL